VCCRNWGDGVSEDGENGTKESAAPQFDLRRSLFSSFSVQSVAILLRIVQQIVLVPALISGWGTALYQDWILIFSAAALAGMLDGGMQMYFSNALLIAHARQDPATFRRLFGTAMGIYSITTSAALLALAGASLFVAWPDLLGTKLLAPTSVFWTFAPMVCSTIALVPLGLFAAIYRINGDYVHGTALVVIADAARGLGVCVVALLGGAPVVAGFAYLLICGLLWLNMLTDLRRRFGPLPVSLALPTSGEFKTAVSQSALYFMPTVTTVLVLNLPVILLGRLATVTGAVVAFSVSRTLTGFVRQFVWQICLPVGAEMARQQALEDLPKLRRIFFGGGRLAAGLAGLLGGFTLVAAAPFLRIWTQGAVAFDPLLVSAFLLNILMLAPAQMALALFLYNNRPGILVYSQAGYTIGTIVFCSLLIKGLAAAGAAVGTGIAETLSVGLLVPFAARRHVGLPLGRYFLQCYVVAAGSFATSWGAARLILSIIDGGGLLALIAAGLIWAVVVAPPAFFLLISPVERSWVLERGRRFLSRGRAIRGL
jgi:O-antigen/teichoic acid export membrane protein